MFADALKSIQATSLVYRKIHVHRDVESPDGSDDKTYGLNNGLWRSGNYRSQIPICRMSFCELDRKFGCYALK